MSGVKYIMSTPWSKIRQDWRDYKELCCIEKIAHSVARDRYDDMVVDFGEQDEDVTLNATGCIVKCIHIYPDFGRDSDPMVRFCESRCLKFNDSALCADTQCEYYPANMRFCDAMARFEMFRRLRKSFWKNKFNEKQR